MAGASLDQARPNVPDPPAMWKEEKKKKERFYIYSDVTHTHTH